MHAPHAPHGHVAPADSRRGRMARAGSRRRCAQLGTSGSRGTPIRRPRKAYIWYDVPTASSTSPAPLRLPPATPPRHDPHRATWHAPRHAPLLAPALRSPRPATPKPSAAQNAHPALGHFVTTQTTRLRHHARRGMCRRRPPAHVNLPAGRAFSLQTHDFKMLQTRPGLCPPSASNRENAIPLPLSTAHVGVHMPGQPSTSPLPAHAAQSGSLPQGRPTPWATRPCWRKISDLTLFPHLPLDIM
jgi:hypothetical protein